MQTIRILRLRVGKDDYGTTPTGPRAARQSSAADTPLVGCRRNRRLTRRRPARRDPAGGGDKRRRIAARCTELIRILRLRVGKDDYGTTPTGPRAARQSSAADTPLVGCRRNRRLTRRRPARRDPAGGGDKRRRIAARCTELIRILRLGVGRNDLGTTPTGPRAIRQSRAADTPLVGCRRNRCLTRRRPARGEPIGSESAKRWRVAARCTELIRILRLRVGRNDYGAAPTGPRVVR